MTDFQLLNAIRDMIREEIARLKSDAWLTEAEAAKHLKVSPNRMAEFRPKAGRLLGKRWRYSRQLLDRCLFDPFIRR